MKRLVFLLSTLALALAGPAAAKGPDQATITGPGLDGGKIVFRSGGGDPTRGSKFFQFVENVGFFPAVFRQTPDPMLDKRPAGRLGPRYRVVYRVPGPDGGNATVRQDVYPYASIGVVSYMKPGQSVFDGRERTRGGWYVAGRASRGILVSSGFPSTSPGGGDGSSWLDPVSNSLLVTVLVVLLLGIAAAALVTRRPRFRPAS
jgi:hypothetical protein